MNLGLVVMGGAILSNLLIQFSVDGLELCSLPAIYLGPNCGGGNEDNGDFLQKVPHIWRRLVMEARSDAANSNIA